MGVSFLAGASFDAFKSSSIYYPSGRDKSKSICIHSSMGITFCIKMRIGKVLEELV